MAPELAAHKHARELRDALRHWSNKAPTATQILRLNRRRIDLLLARADALFSLLFGARQTSLAPIVTILNGKNDKFRIKLIQFEPPARGISRPQFVLSLWWLRALQLVILVGCCSCWAPRLPSSSNSACAIPKTRANAHGDTNSNMTLRPAARPAR